MSMGRVSRFESPADSSSAKGASLSRRLLLRGVLAGVGAAAVPILLPAAQALAQPTGRKITLRVANNQVVDSQNGHYLTTFIEAVRKKTGGQVEIQRFDNAALGQEDEALRAVNLGTLEMSTSGDQFLKDAVPEAGVQLLPFVFRSVNHALASLQGPPIKELDKKIFDKTNVMVLGRLGYGFRHMWFRNKRVTTLADFKGLKMRSIKADVYLSMFEALGANPTPISFSETYTALQSGVVDGVDGALQVNIEAKFHEVTKYVLLTGHVFASTSHFVNKRIFQQWPANVQQAMMEAAREAENASNEEARRSETNGLAAIKKFGLTVDEPTDRPAWVAATKIQRDKFVSNAPDAGRMLRLIEGISG